MKRYLLILLAAAAMMTACQEKKQSTVIIAPKPEAPKPSGPVEMQDMNAQNEVEWIGKTYKVVVSRKVDRELPMVEVEPGKKAYDNRINLRILRPDGTEFFNRDFTKSAFAGCLDETTKDSGVLLGIVLDRAEGDDLIFAASVGSPDVLSDEFIPMVLTVTRMGEVSIQRDTTMDTSNGQEQEEEDEGV
jgi:hypothetical protein